ncbi:MAG TPA: protein kinase [Anaerolineales bacterium]|nr:protein kinase [Anaerolineales bacterium]
MSSNWVGKTLGKVKIESKLARGGMAEVYLGTHINLERKVAVKILRNPSEEHSDDLERFQREARVIASLRHSNIVQVFDFDTVDNDPYLVMEYVDGPSLSAYLHNLHGNEKKLKLPHVMRMLNGVASALQYAHNNKIVHRDIKPGNILLTSPTQKIELGEPLPDDFVPVLTDFGLIRFLDAARQTTTGITAGTPAYMSPEQAQGEATDGQTDVYSLGVVLYEMLAGKLPFDGETTMGILLKHINEPPPPIPGLSPFMQDVLNRALAKNREDRFPSPADFAKAFSAAVEINPATIQMDALASDGPYTLQMEDAPKAGQSKRSGWMRMAAIGVIAAIMGTLFFFNQFPSLASETESAPETQTPAISTSSSTLTSTNTVTATPLPPVNLETSLVIHFRDENAIADQAFLEVKRVPAAPEGSNYEVWLFNARRERISLGILTLDELGKGELTFTDEQGTNLVSKYDQAEITLEPEDDSNPAPTKLIAFQFSLPEDGIVHIRSLLASYPAISDKTALIQGLYTYIKRINELAGEMDSAYTSGNEALVRQSAEAIMNMVVGKQSSSYQDWDEDGSITDDSNGYGLQLNGSNLGYFGATYTEASNAIDSINVSEPIQRYGQSLKICVQNLAQWTPQLQELILDILESPAGSDTEEQIADAVALTDQMLNGVDLNNNGAIEPIAGECGAQFAYQYAYGMADMPLISTGLIAGLGTPTPPGGLYQPTSIGGNNDGGGGGSTPQPGHTPPGQVKTDKPPNTNQPTKKPKSNEN